MAQKIESLLSGPSAGYTGGVLIVGKAHVIEKASKYQSLRDFEIFQNASLYNVEIESFPSHSSNALNPPSCSFNLAQPKQPYAFITTTGPTPTMVRGGIHQICRNWLDYSP